MEYPWGKRIHVQVQMKSQGLCIARPQGFKLLQSIKDLKTDTCKEDVSDTPKSSIKEARITNKKCL